MNITNDNLSKYKLMINDLNNELTLQKEYNKSLLALYDGVSGFKHDFYNIISTMGGFIQTNDVNGLKKYYSDLQNDCIKLNTISLLNPEIINNPGIYNLLCSKYEKADMYNILVNLEYFADINSFNINTYILSRILGILLDNAIEAAKECNKKIINISIRKEDLYNRNIIVISNTYNDKTINTDEIFKKGKSGKTNHSGIGLWEVREYVKRNKNLNLSTEKNDSFFTQRLEIYY